jgi:hypothetical protein
VAHYAFIDANNVVVEVCVGRDEGEMGIDWEAYYGERRGLLCKRTSYNTLGGVHVRGGTPYRGNYAGIGYVYHADLDAFIPPKPHDDATLNTTTFSWE